MESNLRLTNLTNDQQKLIYKYGYRKFFLFFIVTLITIFYSIIIDYWIRGYQGADYLVFYTHLSNLMILSYLGFFLIFKKPNKLILVALPAIVLTGIIYMILMFPFLLTTWFFWAINPDVGQVWIFEPYPYGEILNAWGYLFISITSTLLLHLVVPLFSFLFLRSHFKKETNGKMHAYWYNLIWFVIYLGIVQLSIFVSVFDNVPGIGPAGSNGQGDAPYFFVDFRYSGYPEFLIYIADVFIYLFILWFMNFLVKYLKK